MKHAAAMLDLSTRRGLWAGVASLVLCVACVAALCPAIVGSSAANAQVPPASARPALPQMIGFDVPVPHLDNLDAAKAQLDRVTELGGNAVRFVVPLYQPHAGSAAPRLDQRASRGPADADLLALIAHARQLGLHTALVPRVSLTRPGVNDRVADLSPPRWEPWWIAYAEGVMHYARLAERGGVDVLGLADGSDSALDPLRHDGALPRWDALLADARDAFSGSITLWADTPRAVVTADALGLDFIGVRPDLRLDPRDVRDLRDDRRREAAVARRWRELRDASRDAARTQRRAVLIAGVGVAARADAWAGLEYEPFAPAFADENVTAVTAVQSESLRTFLSAWRELLPPPPGSGETHEVAGVFFAHWSLTGRGGPFDPGYALQGKPAEAILRRYISGDHQ